MKDPSANDPSTVGLPEDFADLFVAFVGAGVEFLVVGSYALARHGYVRATLDLDVFVRPTDENAARVFRALREYGAPLAAHGVEAADFARPGTVYQLGVPPLRIDVLTEIPGVTFEDAWASRVVVALGGVAVAVIGREMIVRNKRTSGRPKDLLDVAELERLGDSGPAPDPAD